MAPSPRRRPRRLHPHARRRPRARRGIRGRRPRQPRSRLGPRLGDRTDSRTPAVPRGARRPGGGPLNGSRR
ncbi:MAG: hypothetical protein E6Q97_08185 [Desulfurellales bacterium]|nr:MAG: hypothetical protein E6Q97_08185 [Desulfurellales bacterium]